MNPISSLIQFKQSVNCSVQFWNHLPDETIRKRTVLSYHSKVNDSVSVSLFTGNKISFLGGSPVQLRRKTSKEELRRFTIQDWLAVHSHSDERSSIHMEINHIKEKQKPGQGTRTQCASGQQENSDDNVPQRQSHIHGFSLYPSLKIYIYTWNISIKLALIASLTRGRTHCRTYYEHNHFSYYI